MPESIAVLLPFVLAFLTREKVVEIIFRKVSLHLAAFSTVHE
jgi:hypothetical protein